MLRKLVDGSKRKLYFDWMDGGSCASSCYAALYKGETLSRPTEFQCKKEEEEDDDAINS